jgi:hypothetical protein
MPIGKTTKPGPARMDTARIGKREMSAVIAHCGHPPKTAEELRRAMQVIMASRGGQPVAGVRLRF